MQYIFFFVVACALLVITGCGGNGKDYTSSAECQAQGKTPGTKEYDDCLIIEKMNRLRAEQDERDKQQDLREQQQMIFRR
jgi:hypothetical protein